MSNSGTVKCFNPAKNFGFITASDGSELFVHSTNCKGGVPKEGDAVTFDIQECPKKPGQNEATNVVGGTGAMPGVMGSGSRQGVVKSFNAMQGWGFITSDGEDVFVHIRDCQGGAPQAGDTVAFDIDDNPVKPGTTKAANVTGGTGDLYKGKGKGKGGKGGKDGGSMWDMMMMGGMGGGYGPMWGMKGSKGGCSPYGGKGGKGGKGMGGMGGKGKGWGMGGMGMGGMGMGGMGGMMGMGWY